MSRQRKIILVIDDDESSRVWAQQARFDGEPVLTTDCERGWDTILKHAEHLDTILIRIDDYEKGLVLALIGVKAGVYHIGIISPTTPEHLDKTMFSMNRKLVSLSRGDDFLLDDGGIDWVELYESLTKNGPMMISIPPL